MTTTYDAGRLTKRQLCAFDLVAVGRAWAAAQAVVVGVLALMQASALRGTSAR